ncbi:MAG: hypothetical protein KY468_06840 [Armatimonadetes bacterium]|nr:hypothetical protein [Armatimonadota bacterium]
MRDLKRIVGRRGEGGVTRMRYSISDTAENGDLTRSPKRALLSANRIQAC